jgi:hypothetical protein
VSFFSAFFISSHVPLHNNTFSALPSCSGKIIKPDGFDGHCDLRLPPNKLLLKMFCKEANKDERTCMTGVRNDDAQTFFVESSLWWLENGVVLHSGKFLFLSYHSSKGQSRTQWRLLCEA